MQTYDTGFIITSDGTNTAVESLVVVWFAMLIMGLLVAYHLIVRRDEESGLTQRHTHQWQKQQSSMESSMEEDQNSRDATSEGGRVPGTPAAGNEARAGIPFPPSPFEGGSSMRGILGGI